MAVKVTEPSIIKNEQIYEDIWKTEVGKEKTNSNVFSPFLAIEGSWDWEVFFLLLKFFY